MKAVSTRSRRAGIEVHAWRNGSRHDGGPVTGRPTVAVRALRRVRGRSRIWQKLAVIGLAFALPLAVTTRFLVVESDTKIHFAANEVRGVEYLRPLNALLVDLTIYKAVDRALLASERPDGHRAAAEDRVDADYAALVEVDARLGPFLRTTVTDLNQNGIRAAPPTQAANWRALKSRPASLERNERLRTLLIADVRTLISYVGLTSNLVLDPHLATYHSAHALVRRGPELTDRLADLSETVDRLLVDKKVTFRDKTRVASAVALLQTQVVAMQEELFTAFSDARRGGNTHLEDDVGPLLLTAFVSVSGFSTLTTLGLVQAETVTMDRGTYRRAGDRASRDVADLWITLAAHEATMLRERQEGDAHDRLIALSTVLASLFLTVVLTLWLSRRIATRVGTVARAAAGLAAGDLTRRVVVRGRDEIGEMSTAFNGMAERLQTVVEDQQSSQRTLRAERDFVGAVLEVAGSLVLVLDRSGRIVRFNRACELTTGYDADEVVGVPFWDLFITAEEAVGVRAVFAGLSSGSFPMMYENDWIARSGSVRRIAWANTALIDDSGEVTHVIATGIDYTERRQAEDAVDRMRRHNELVLTSAGEGIVGLDADGRTTFVNPSAARMLGLTPDELVGSTLHEMIHGHRPGGDSHQAVDCPLQATVLGGVATRDASEVFWRADGTSLPAEYLSTPIRENGELLGAVVTFDDITTRRAAETDLREAQERFRQAFDNAVIGMCLVDLDGTFLQVNRSLCLMLDYSDVELLSRTASSITHPEDVVETGVALGRMAAGESSTYKTEKRYVAADGRVVWALVAASIVRSQDGTPLYFVTQIEDITERREAARQLTFQALHDPLTGLPNRALLMDRLRLAVARAARTPTVNAVFFVDLDGFKAVNDSLGHDVGDQVLRDVARRLAACIRPSDTAARLGGDEFVVLCEGVGSAQGALDIAERLERALSPDVDAAWSDLAITASIGIAIATDAAVATPESLLSDADAAMYRAKARGKNRFEVFDEELRVRAIDRLDVESTLRLALREERFLLHFQPVVDLASGEVVGVESLVRLDHPERGILPPGDFIQVAEDSGLIVPIGSWVVGEACRQLAAWRAAGAVPAGMPTAVNLSARQANRPDLVQTITRALDESGVEPGALALELTETVLMEADTVTIRQLEELRDMGVRLGIDDFGTGYSSLTYLKRLPVSFVKVDRSFVAGVVDDPSDRAIVTAVVGLADALGLTTIAEGVETAEQLAALREIGCEQAQGYYLGRPQPGPPALLGIPKGACTRAG